MTDAELRAYIEDRVAAAAKRRGVPVPALGDEVNLLETGIIDSMGFLDLVAAVETRFGIEVSFADPEPGAFTSLRGLVAQCLRGRRRG